ncbi:MAG: antitoxin [Streptococcus gallolyticus]|nr:antitoxin [Streptococcus gallolyticus]
MATSTMTIRLKEEEKKLISDYASINSLNPSTFIRNLVLDTIEEDLKLDEERLLLAKAKIDKEAQYDHEEFWNKLGV